jgi:DNA-binding CsgD family transcriptional regulator
MTTSLQPLFETINQAKKEPDLRSQVVPKLGEHFAAKRSGIFFFDQLPFTDPTLQQALNNGLFSIEHNPIVRYLVERHAPVHEALITSPKVWKAICPRSDHWHVMAGPIISCGRLVGILGCTREKSMPPFDAQNLADMGAICLHLSVWAATVRAQPMKTDRLTARELQIAELVASGQTNAEIGAELWITENSVKQALKRMFRKLEVSSRAEMVARLSRQKTR